MMTDEVLKSPDTPTQTFALTFAEKKFQRLSFARQRICPKGRAATSTIPVGRSRLSATAWPREWLGQRAGRILMVSRSTATVLCQGRGAPSNKGMQLTKPAQAMELRS
jgi:hypothetical protein